MKASFIHKELDSAMSIISYTIKAYEYGSPISDGLTLEKFSQIKYSFKHLNKSKTCKSGFFRESAKQIDEVLAALNAEQLRMVIYKEADIFEIMRAKEFESALQSTLSEKPTTTRKIKI